MKIKDKIELLRRLNQFAQSFGEMTTIEKLASSVSEVLEDLLEFESSGLYLYDFQAKRLKLLAAKGFTPEEFAEADRTAMERHPGFVFRTGQVLNIPDTENDPTQRSKTSNRSFIVRSRLYMPVLSSQKPVGAFGIVSSQKNNFTEEHREVLSFICNLAGAKYSNLLHLEEQQKSHDTLAATTVRLTTLIKNLQSGILVEDQYRRIALINQTFCNLFGIPVAPDLLVGSDCSDSAEQSKGMFTDPATFVNRIEEILNQKQPVTGEVLELCDGRTFERDYIPIFLEGRFLGNLWEYRDTTTRMTTERDLRKAMSEANMATTAKSAFLANMSHELRTPLNAVIGLSRLMRDTTLNAEQKMLNNKLLLSGENLLMIINEILDFSKIEAGRVELEHIPFDLQQILHRIQSFLIHLAEEKGIGLSVNMEEPLSQAVVGDPGRLQQVLINLMNNALKFTSQGGVTLTCTLIGVNAGKAKVHFSVADTGIGISEENIANIFEKFKQEDESVTRVYGGTGLGLSISQQLVALMGGNLEVVSKKGEGSTFFFTLEFETTALSALQEMKKRIAINPHLMTGRKVLVAEDNQLNQFIIKSILKKWNISTDIVSNGKEAVDCTRQNQYDLILMDMQMPVMDGLQATVAIRSELQVQIPVIALTAYATKGAIENAINAGMNGYVTKPFEEETLYIQLLKSFNIEPEYQEDTNDARDLGTFSSDSMNLHYDLDKLSKLLGDEPSEIISLIESFIEITPTYSGALFQAFEQNDIEQVAKESHKIKSSLELLASGNLRNNINLIHQYSRKKENLEKLPKLIRYYKQTLPVLMSQLEEKVKEMRDLATRKD